MVHDLHYWLTFKWRFQPFRGHHKWFLHFRKKKKVIYSRSIISIFCGRGIGGYRTMRICPWPIVYFLLGKKKKNHPYYPISYFLCPQVPPPWMMLWLHGPKWILPEYHGLNANCWWRLFGRNHLRMIEWVIIMIMVFTLFIY